MYTTYTYGQDFTIECTIQQNAHEPELLLYWTDKNGANISNDSQSTVWQRRLSGTAVELSIRDFNTSHNGNYTCHAQNSNTDNRKHITLIGKRERILFTMHTNTQKNAKNLIFRFATGKSALLLKALLVKRNKAAFAICTYFTSCYYYYRTTC